MGRLKQIEAIKQVKYRYLRCLDSKLWDEMRAVFKDLPEAYRNTLAVAERCNVDLQFGQFHLPKYQVPEGFTLDSSLRRLALQTQAEDETLPQAGSPWRQGESAAEVSGRGVIPPLGQIASAQLVVQPGLVDVRAIPRLDPIRENPHLPRGSKQERGQNRQ